MLVDVDRTVAATTDSEIGRYLNTAKMLEVGNTRKMNAHGIPRSYNP
jgi:hypothetical protein